MRQMRIYVDTSVFGGAFDEQFALASQQFIDRAKQGRYVVLISAITFNELQGAPDHVRRLVEDMPVGSLEEIKIDQEVVNLAEAYIASGTLGPLMKNDALHVAAATIAKANAILSWNFKHIVNFDKILKFNGVNMMNGYSQIAIYSPLEMIYDDQDKDI
jgi:predicted nucleic acid-binding protein